MLFTRHTRADGTEAVTVDDWDEDCPFSPEFLKDGSREFVTVEGDIINLKVANGWAKYQIVNRDDWRGIMLTRLLSSFIDGRD